MEKSKAAKLVINVEDTSERRSKRKSVVSPKKTPPNKQPASLTAKKMRSKKDWQYIIPKERWFPGKITTSVSKGVLSSIQSKLSDRQKLIMKGTCFAHFLDCHEIVVQPQLIHYFLLRQVQQPNPTELWFLVAERYVRFSISEFCIVTGLRCSGDSDTGIFENRQSQLKNKYFSQVDIVTHEDVKSTFISACQMPDLDLVETLPNHDVALIGILYFITAYLFSKDYKKLVDHYLFTLVEDFPALNSFPWGKLLFEITLSSLKDALSRQTAHYRLRGMLVAFQAWIYKTFPDLDEVIVTRVSRTHPRINNWNANEQPSTSKLEELGCFNKPNIEICDLKPTEAEMAMPYMDVPLVTDTGVRKAHITNDDDDFVDPPRRCEGLSHQETPRADEGPSGPPLSPNEEQHHGIQASAVLHDLNAQLSELKSQNKVLTVEMDAIKSQMSSLNSDQAKKMSEIILIQGQLKHDMIEIRTNMQFLSESVTAMISSSMDEILRRFNDRKGCPVNEYEDTEAAVEGFEKIDEVEKLQPVVDRKGKGKVDPTEDVTFPSSLEPPSFDLGIEYTQPDDLESSEIQKQVDAIISDVITASQNVDEEGSPTTEPASALPVKRASTPARILRSPFVVREGKVLRHDGNVIVFGNYKDHVDEADKSAFLGRFQRGKKFNEQDDQIKPAFSIGLYPVGHKTWFYQLINAETSLSGSEW
ncbi:uncharacterized protein LOC111406765 [Olea europaea var. sylvestris]|uniref:uncharacterized protein LOC111406765 n=1 Tax=Olea europaea var. sylvestris TaxID=158386 RepID=UPI000C1CF06A|nr:uncharacterized protein LOC111406765 [Olea europaea var. sylvestris]